MKYLFLSFLTLFLFSLDTEAQNTNGFGFKGGLNYSVSGSLYDSASNIAENPTGNIGFNFGLFAKYGGFIYVKPEIVYTNISSDYNDGTFKMQKIDVPLLGGIRLIKVLNIFIGPSFQYIIESDFDNNNVQDLNDFTVGLNVGLGVSFKKIGIDLRYERGFSENEATILNNNNINLGTIDTRVEQFILSISFVL